MGTIGKRLAEERKRLGYTQPTFAALGGASKRTMVDWEQDVTSPNAVFLAAIANVGADILYILTGQQSQNPNQLPPREAALLDNYRHCDDEAKRVIEGVAGLASQPQSLKAKTKHG